MQIILFSFSFSAFARAICYGTTFISMYRIHTFTYDNGLKYNLFFLCLTFLTVFAACPVPPFCLSCFGYAEPGAVASRHITLESHLDIHGGAMVDVQGNIAAVDHMGPPYETTLIDAIDPAKPRIIAWIQARPGTHYHKARICEKNLVLNVESYGGGVWQDRPCIVPYC
jgi:hypothetical protein